MRELIADFRARRTLLSHRLQRLNEAIARWDEYEANARLPVELRQEMTAPTVSRSSHAIAKRGVMEELLE